MRAPPIYLELLECGSGTRVGSSRWRRPLTVPREEWCCKLGMVGGFGVWHGQLQSFDPKCAEMCRSKIIISCANRRNSLQEEKAMERAKKRRARRVAAATILAAANSCEICWMDSWLLLLSFEARCSHLDSFLLLSLPWTGGLADFYQISKMDSLLPQLHTAQNLRGKWERGVALPSLSPERRERPRRASPVRRSPGRPSPRPSPRRSPPRRCRVLGKT